MRTIQRQEWPWLLLSAAAIMLLTSLPYLYGAWLSTPAMQFGGLVLGVEDGYSYLGKMRLGEAGQWQFYLFYTSEPHAESYLYLFHILLGQLAAWLGLPLAVMYHLARVLFGVGLLVMAYRFIAHFVEEVAVRRLALWLFAVGSGLGWLVVLLNFDSALGQPLDFYSPEAVPFQLLFSLPHLSLALTLLLGGVLLLLQAWAQRSYQLTLLAGLCFFALTVIAAF